MRQVVDQIKGGPNNPSLILSLHQALDFSRPFVNFVEPFKHAMSYKKHCFCKMGPRIVSSFAATYFCEPELQFSFAAASQQFLCRKNQIKI